MLVYANGRRFEVPDDVDGLVSSDDLREMADIPSDRVMILQKPDGSNRTIPPGVRVRVDPRDHVTDTPNARRGGVAP